MILRCYGPQSTTVLSDKLNIALRSSKSTGQTQRDVLRDVLCSHGLFRGLQKVITLITDWKKINQKGLEQLLDLFLRLSVIIWASFLLAILIPLSLLTPLAQKCSENAGWLIFLCISEEKSEVRKTHGT